MNMVIGEEIVKVWCTLNHHPCIQRCNFEKFFSKKVRDKTTFRKIDSVNVLRLIFSVMSVAGELPAPPGFLTHSGCGCNTVSCTVIDCRVFRCQAAELHVGCAGGCVCSQCGLALELLIVLSITISRKKISNPLQALSWLLLHPVNSVASEGVARSLAGQLH